MQEEESQLLDKAMKGDRLACRKLIDRYQNYVYQLVFKIVRNQEDAEEVAQDTFIKAFKYLSGFNRKSQFSTWLYRIAYNTALSHLRKRKLPKSGLYELPEHVVPESDDPSGLDRLMEDQQKTLIEQALQQLPHSDRTLITLYYLQELNIAEISQAMHLDGNTIKVRLFRARKKLHQLLGHALGDETGN